MTTKVSRRAHAVEEHAELSAGFVRVKLMLRRVYLQIGRAASVEFLEQQPEPVRVFVKDGDRFGFRSHLVLPWPKMFAAKNKKAARLSGLGDHCKMIRVSLFRAIESAQSMADCNNTYKRSSRG
jgi:hypothetical protein